MAAITETRLLPARFLTALALIFRKGLISGEKMPQAG